MFAKLLVANRGEIACRIIRTARQMGISTVAVYSDADRDAAHVAMADEAYAIGPAPARQSYLDGDKIIETARRCGAEAIHPGYGFLSENAGFAEACAAAGHIFVGPPAAAIRAMGGKSDAKALMTAAGVPVVPGYHGAEQAEKHLAQQAASVGYPVLLKASAGGGGKGMRIVERPQDFKAELAGARREALAAFGDERMLIEKYLIRPRHIEVQVFADNHGRCVALFERDCSIQRRHQKVIEEAPAPGLSAELRRRMQEAAVAAAKSIGYSGAGTIEFLLDISGDFYFMEMNTRLQVEHPVTEFITGLDLVEWQLRVAAGEALPQAWDRLTINGHAIEARLYAEDPAHDFLPSTGRIRHLVLPAQTAELRIDSGIRTGDAITPHYDPMIAKLIVHGPDRETAVRRLGRALGQVAIAGVSANTGFLARLARLPDFVHADLDTGFIPRNEAALLTTPAPDATAIGLAALGIVAWRKAEAKRQAVLTADPHSPWASTDSFRLNAPARETLRLAISGNSLALAIRHDADGIDIETEGQSIRAEGRLSEDGLLSANIDGAKRTAHFFADVHEFALFIDGEHLRIALPDDLEAGSGVAASGGLTAPMPGFIRAVLVSVGTQVEQGQALVVMEAMKMEHTIRAPSAGTIGALHAGEGAMVEAGTVLVEFEAEGG